MFWPFKRKPKPIVPQWSGPRSVDWKIGDIGECIADNWYIEGPTRPSILPKRGNRYIVRQVSIETTPKGSRILFALRFIGMPDGYSTRAFRKIVLDDLEVDQGTTKKVPLKEKMLSLEDVCRQAGEES